MGFDYSDIGITPMGVDQNSLGARPLNRITALEQDVKVERSPYLPPTSITKGSVISTLGGIITFKDKTGGTTIFTYDPETGTITLSGGILINQTLNLGTVSDSVFIGSTSNAGQLYLGQVFSGTLNGVLFQSGTISNSQISGTVGTAMIQGGTVNAAKVSDSFFSSGTITSPTYQISAGSGALSADGRMDFQTYGTGVCLVIRLSGTSFRFMPSGTI